MTGSELVWLMRKLDTIRKELAGIRREVKELEEGLLEAATQGKQEDLPYDGHPPDTDP